MLTAFYGALIGLAVGVVLVGTEYLLLSRAAEVRAARKHEKAELDPTERARVASVTRFSALLPLAFAFVAWLVWG